MIIFSLLSSINKTFTLTSRYFLFNFYASILSWLQLESISTNISLNRFPYHQMIFHQALNHQCILISFFFFIWSAEQRTRLFNLSAREWLKCSTTRATNEFVELKSSHLFRRKRAEDRRESVVNWEREFMRKLFWILHGWENAIKFIETFYFNALDESFGNESFGLKII